MVSFRLLGSNCRFVSFIGRFTLEIFDGVNTGVFKINYFLNIVFSSFKHHIVATKVYSFPNDKNSSFLHTNFEKFDKSTLLTLLPSYFDVFVHL